MAISPANKYPRAFITVIFGAGRQSPLTAPRKILLTGYAARVGGSQGVSADNVLQPLPSVDDAIYWFGGGSEIHQECVAVFDEAKDATVYGISYPEAGGGAYQEQTLTIATTSVLGGTLSLFVNGQQVDTPILPAMTAADQATAVYTNLSKYKNLPCYCPTAPGGATVVFRWKHKGLRGTQFKLRYRVDTITGTTYSIASTNAGATDADPSSALDAVATKRFHYIVCPDPTSDATVGIGRFMQYINNRADPLIGLRGQLACATTDTYANAVTLATGINMHRFWPIWCRNAEDTVARIAARWAAWVVNGTASDPTANLCNTTLNSLYGPVLISDHISEAEATNALNNGLTCIRFTEQDQPFIPRPITGRSQDVNSNPDYRTLDIGKVLEPDFLGDFFDSDIPVTFQGYKLEDDAPNGEGQPLLKVMTPSLFRSYLAGILVGEFRAQRAKNPQSFIDGGELQCFINPNNAQRLTCDLPLDVIDILAQIEMIIRQVG